MVAAYLRAASFDLLARATYNWRIREDRTSTGQQKHELRQLTDRIEVKREAWAMMLAEASPPVRDAWIGRVLDLDFAAYIDHALRGDDTYRATLRAAYETYLGLASPAALADVRVQHKVRAHLVARGAWDELEAAQAYFVEAGTLPPTTIVDGRVTLERALPDRLGVELPPEILEPSWKETRLRACALRLEWIGHASVRLTGWAFIRGIDLDERSATLELSLVGDAGTRPVALEVERRSLPEATSWADWPHGGHDDAGFEVVIDFEHLLASDPSVREWSLLARVTVEGVSREGPMRHAVAGSSAARPTLRSQLVREDGTAVVPRFDNIRGLTFTLRAPGVIAEALEQLGDERTLRGRLRPHVMPVGVRATDPATGTEVEAGGTRRLHDSHEFELSLPTDPGVADWELRVVDDEGVAHEIEWPVGGDPAGPGWHRSPRGHVHLASGPLSVEAVDVGLAPDAITARLADATHAPNDPASFVLTGPRASVAATDARPAAEGGLVLSFPWTIERFGLSSRPLPPGSYAIEVTDVAGRTGAVALAPALAARAPVEGSTGHHRARVVIDGERGLRIELSAALDADEATAHGQERLRQQYAWREATPAAAVLFLSDGGAAATGSPLAIHRELRRRGSRLNLVWAVTDASVAVPDGGSAVLIGSREWYAALASVTHLCADADIGAFFRKRPHQRFLRIFDDDPALPMAAEAWWAEGWTPGRIARELARCHATWDAILVAAPFAGRYREAFEYGGVVHASGLPRTDSLVGDSAAARRAQTRDRLAIGVDTRVVLAIPARRRSSGDALVSTVVEKPSDFVDIDLLAGRLGDRFAILHRGPVTRTQPGGATVLDVSEYPDINDLVLAADVAVLGDRSLRFDWALTGKPMVFHDRDPASQAPDPGPALATTEEIAAALADLERLRSRYAGAVAAFDRTHNPANDGHAAERIVDAFFDPS